MSLADFLPALDALVVRGKATAPAARLAVVDIIRRGARLTLALEAGRAGATARIPVPLSEVFSLARTIDGFIATYFDDLDFDSALFAALRVAQRRLLSLQALRRFFAAQDTVSADRANDAARPTVAPLVPYQLRQGDTLERLALRFLGDVARAAELIELNDLAYPFLDTARSLAPAEFARHLL